MKYLLLLNRATDALPGPGTPAAQAMLREYTTAVRTMAEAGVLVDCAPLTAVSAATTVRVRDHRLPGPGRRAQVGGGHARGAGLFGRSPRDRRHRGRTLRPDLDVAHPLPSAPWFPPGETRSARRVFLHIIAETAQHAGHADIIRESLDGAKSMG